MGVTIIEVGKVVSKKIIQSVSFIHQQYQTIWSNKKQVVTTAGFTACLLSLVLPYNAYAERTLTDDELRAAAPAALELADVPNMDHLDEFVINRQYAIALGKAFFWDQQTGGDGITACASCHFRAGADSRSRNQLNPGLLDQTPGVDSTAFAVTPSGGGGTNYQLVAGDFPLPKSNNDVVSSQGVYLREFISFQQGGSDNCDSVPDAVFHSGGLNLRRVEPRNTPTVINAVFNHRNFWDGRANHIFNGVDPLGPRTFLGPEGASKGIYVMQADGSLQLEQPRINNSSLASQAVGPPLSAFEMSCGDVRSFPDLGRKMSRLRALAGQAVASDDSVLGAFRHSSGQGIVFNYSSLIRRAFDRKYWGARGRVTINGQQFTQMEANFSLFWGLAIQLYEATLVSNQTPFDSFMRGDNLAMNDLQKEGLEIFLDANRGNCIACHAGPEFTGASVRLRAGANGEAVERMIMGNGAAALYDGGFYNIGVRGTLEDLGVGANLGTLADGTPIPLSFSRQLTQGIVVDEFNQNPAVDAEEVGLVPEGPAVPGERVAVDGAFKTPTVRNAELTAPFFHNGSHGTLEQVVDFYKDQGRNFFALDNIDDLDPDILEIDIAGGEIDALVAFMEALTDNRVRLDQAPFDHPELRIPNGHTTPITPDAERPLEAVSDFLVIPVVGAGGYATPPANFLE